jgi:hypothetical protein
MEAITRHQNPSGKAGLGLVVCVTNSNLRSDRELVLRQPVNATTELYRVGDYLLKVLQRHLDAGTSSLHTTGCVCGAMPEQHLKAK